MADNSKHLKNLSDRTPEERSEIAKKGAKASHYARRRNKLLSGIYAQMLADRYDVQIKGESKRISGEKFFSAIVKEILTRKDSASVAMIKEIREATEGSKFSSMVSLTDERAMPENRHAAFLELQEKSLFLPDERTTPDTPDPDTDTDDGR